MKLSQENKRLKEDLEIFKKPQLTLTSVGVMPESMAFSVEVEGAGIAWFYGFSVRE